MGCSGCRPVDYQHHSMSEAVQDFTQDLHLNQGGVDRAQQTELQQISRGFWCVLKPKQHCLTTKVQGKRVGKIGNNQGPSPTCC